MTMFLTSCLQINKGRIFCIMVIIAEFFMHLSHGIDNHTRKK